MPRLNRQDRSCDSRVSRVRDVLVRTGVGADTNVLDGVGERDEALGVRVRERVGTRLSRGVPDGGREELDVGSFVLGDLGDTGSDPVGETGVAEVVGGELGEGAGAEVSDDPGTRYVHGVERKE